MKKSVICELIGGFVSLCSSIPLLYTRISENTTVIMFCAYALFTAMYLYFFNIKDNFSKIAFVSEIAIMHLIMRRYDEPRYYVILGLLGVIGLIIAKVVDNTEK